MLVWILPQVVQTIKPQTIKPTGNGYLSSSKNKAWKKIKTRTGFDPMTSTISMQRSINWVKIRPERWRFHIHFFIRSSHDFYIFTVLTITATAITTTATYFCTLGFNFMTLCSQLNINGVTNWCLFIWGLHLISFAGFPFPYFPTLQIVDVPVLRVSSEALEMNSSARRWRQHNLRCVFRRWRRNCKRL